MPTLDASTVHIMLHHLDQAENWATRVQTGASLPEPALSFVLRDISAVRRALLAVAVADVQVERR